MQINSKFKIHNSKLLIACAKRHVMYNSLSSKFFTKNLEFGNLVFIFAVRVRGSKYSGDNPQNIAVIMAGVWSP